VAATLLCEADRTLIIVPSPKVAQKRNEELRTFAETAG
jgi:hypothetical protein